MAETTGVTEETNPVANPAARNKASTRRSVATLALLVLVGAIAVVVASAVTWWTQSHVDSLSGAVATRAKGSQTDALLIPVALIALAGFGAAVATGGPIRRAVGGVLVLGGGSAAALAALGLFRAPDSLHSDLLRPAESSGAPQLHAAGPLVGLVGGILVAAAGVLLLAGFGARRTTLGSRYDAPTGRRPGPPVRASSVDPATDPEAAANWWRALDAGQDPTETGTAAPSGDASSTEELPAMDLPAAQTVGSDDADLGGPGAARRPSEVPGVSNGSGRDG